jgi:CheY-like chemotaxis protein
LRSSGYEIVEAQNGAAGIEKSASAQPHVILLDFVPPDIFSRFPPTGIRREEGPDFQPEIEMIDATDKSSQDLFEGEISSISGFAKSFSSTIIQLSTKNLTLDTPDPNPPG